MKRLPVKDVLYYLVIVAAICALYRGWDAIIGFLGIVLTAIIPLVLGAAIAYVVSIPTMFLERHFLPGSTSKIVAGMRRPVSLGVTVVLILGALGLSSSVLIPALIETVRMVQVYGQDFIEEVIQLPLLQPVRESVHEFLSGDLVQSFKTLDIGGMVQGVFGGTVGSVTTQLFTVVSTIMTTFFGMLFSFILLTDNTDVGNACMGVIQEYMGPKRTERLALVMGIADSSFHNFIVRQCVEAAILGSVGMAVLLIAGFPYAVGVGVLMGLAALVPIVGYPVGLICGAFMVAIFNPATALIYVVCVAIAQMLEASLLLPHVGDPRTALPPVWVTVAVTIGGGVAGFVGMLVAIPVAASIRQLVITDTERRRRKRELAAEAATEQELEARHMAEEAEEAPQGS